MMNNQVAVIFSKDGNVQIRLEAFGIQDNDPFGDGWASYALKDDYWQCIDVSPNACWDTAIPVNKLPYIVNLTPHPIAIYADNGIYAVNNHDKDNAARVSDHIIDMGTVNGSSIPMSKIKLGNDFSGLPDKVDKRYIYVVSKMFYDAYHLHALTLNQKVMLSSLYTTGPAVRDDDGKTIGCRGLSKPF